MAMILAIDMGKNKSVCSHYNSLNGERTYETIPTSPQAFCDLLTQHPADTVLIEISPLAGWVSDLCRTLKIQLKVVNTTSDAVRRGKRAQRWYPMRQGVMDIRRRSELGMAANGRYLDALAAVTTPAPAQTILDPVSRSLQQKGRRYRALRPIESNDAAVFAAVMQGQFLIKRFANKDVAAALFGAPPPNPEQRRRASGKATRLLRAHGLIRKVSRTHDYCVTPRGSQVMTTAMQLRAVDLSTLAAAA